MRAAAHVHPAFGGQDSSHGPRRAEPFPFRALMRAFVGERAMAPGDFWRMTVPEVVAALVPSAPVDGRAGLDLRRLMERFPDGG